MATSKLEKYLSTALYTTFGHLGIRQNYRPAWMEGLELDFYIDELKLAAEVQGEQHYMFSEFFHRTRENFEKQKDRDAKKRLICRQHKIRLIDVYTEKDADLFVEFVGEVDTTNRPKYFYQSEQPTKFSKKKISRIYKQKKMKTPSMKVSAEDNLLRLERCRQLLKDFEEGKTTPKAGKVGVWKKIIENNGAVL